MKKTCHFVQLMIESLLYGGSLIQDTNFLRPYEHSERSTHITLHQIPCSQCSYLVVLFVLFIQIAVNCLVYDFELSCSRIQMMLQSILFANSVYHTYLEVKTKFYYFSVNYLKKLHLCLICTNGPMQ
jgi:hypothetical protein